MNKILIASHGHLASGIRSSIEILTGMGEKLSVIDAYVDDHNYVNDIKKFVDDLDNETGVIFTDLVGGSVNQKVILATSQYDNIFIVSGVNLPVVLSTLLEAREITQDVLNEIINSSQVELVNLQNESNKENEENFLE